MAIHIPGQRTDALPREAEELFIKGKFRAARELYKELVKIDRTRYLPRLLECYVGQIGQFAEKGMLSEAEVVLDQIKALSGEGAYYVKAKAIIGDTVRKKADAEQTPVPQAWITPEEKLTGLIDRGVIFGEYPAELNEAGLSLVREIEAVRHGLDLLCDTRYAEALEAVREIGFGSKLNQWKLFLKGMAAFYRSDDSNALRAFSNVTAPSGVPRRASLAFRVLLEKDSRTLDDYPNRQRLTADACFVAGKTAVGEYLPRAHYLWRANRYADSLRYMRSAVEKFPDMHGVLGALSSLYYNEENIPERNRNKYIGQLDAYLKPYQSKNAYEAFLIFRSMLCSMLPASGLPFGPSEEELSATVRDFLRAYRELFPDVDLAEAMLFEALGRRFARTPGAAVSGVISEIMGKTSKKRLDAEKTGAAIRFFQKSIATNRAASTAYAGLFDLYVRTGKKREADKLAAAMAEAFPGEKNPQMLAGIHYISHDKPSKALPPLERARSLDPLDGKARGALITALLGVAKKAAEMKDVATMRGMLARGLEQAVPNSPDLSVGAGSVLARWAVNEYIAGNQDEAKARVDEATRGGKNGEYAYFVYCLFSLNGIHGPFVKQLESITGTIFAGDAGIAGISRVADVLSHIRTIVDENKRLAGKIHFLFAETEKLARAFARAVVSPSAPAPSRAEAEKLVRYFAPEKTAKKACRLLVKKFLSADANDPLFGFLDLLLRSAPIRVAGAAAPRDIPVLRAIKNEAEKRGDGALADEVAGIIRTSEDYLSGPPFPPDDFDDEGDDVEPFFDEWPAAPRKRVKKQRTGGERGRKGGRPGAAMTGEEKP